MVGLARQRAAGHQVDRSAAEDRVTAGPGVDDVAQSSAVSGTRLIDPVGPIERCADRLGLRAGPDRVRTGAALGAVVAGAEHDRVPGRPQRRVRWLKGGAGVVGRDADGIVAWAAVHGVGTQPDGDAVVPASDTLTGSGEAGPVHEPAQLHRSAGARHCEIGLVGSQTAQRRVTRDGRGGVGGRDAVVAQTAGDTHDAAGGVGGGECVVLGAAVDQRVAGAGLDRVDVAATQCDDLELEFTRLVGTHVGLVRRPGLLAVAEEGRLDLAGVAAAVQDHALEVRVEEVLGDAEGLHADAGEHRRDRRGRRNGLGVLVQGRDLEDVVLPTVGPGRVTAWPGAAELPGEQHQGPAGLTGQQRRWWLAVGLGAEVEQRHLHQGEVKADAEDRHADRDVHPQEQRQLTRHLEQADRVAQGHLAELEQPELAVAVGIVPGKGHGQAYAAFDPHRDDDGADRCSCSDLTEQRDDGQRRPALVGAEEEQPVQHLRDALQRAALRVLLERLADAVRVEPGVDAGRHGGASRQRDEHGRRRVDRAEALPPGEAERQVTRVEGDQVDVLAHDQREDRTGVLQDREGETGLLRDGLLTRGGGLQGLLAVRRRVVECASEVALRDRGHADQAAAVVGCRRRREGRRTHDRERADRDDQARITGRQRVHERDDRSDGVDELELRAAGHRAERLGEGDQRDVAATCQLGEVGDHRDRSVERVDHRLQRPGDALHLLHDRTEHLRQEPTRADRDLVERDRQVLAARLRLVGGAAAGGVERRRPVQDKDGLDTGQRRLDLGLEEPRDVSLETQLGAHDVGGAAGRLQVGEAEPCAGVRQIAADEAGAVTGRR